MKPQTRTTAALAAAFAALAAVPSYGQTTFNWVGGASSNGNIGTSGNVSPSFVSSSGAVLVFGNAALTGSERKTAVVSAGIDLHSLRFGGSQDLYDFTVSGTQLVTFKAFNSVNPTIQNNSSRTHLVSAPLKMDNPLTLTGNGSGTVTLSGAITTGSLAITKSGTSTFVLSHSSVTGSMALNLNGGVLAVNSANALGSSGTITFGGGTLRYQNGVTTDYSARLADTAGQVYRIDVGADHSVTFGTGRGANAKSLNKSGAGTLVLAPNVTDQTANNRTNNFSNGITLSGGYLQLGNGNAIGTAGTINFAGGGLRATSSNTLDYSARFSTAAGQQYNIDTNGQSVTWASNLQSSGGSLTKNGTGTLILTGNNTYSGTTNVNAGTLAFGSATALSPNTTLNVANGATVNFFNHTISGGNVSFNGNYSTALTVAAGSTWSGNNTVAGKVTVSGKISPGNSPGVQNYASSEWLGGGEYDWEILDAEGVAGTGYDTVNITGTLDLSGLSPSSKFTINVISLSSIGPDVPGDAQNFDETGSFAWTLATAGTISGFNADHFDINLGGFSNAYVGSFSLGVVTTMSNQELTLFYTAIPEPSSVALLLGVGALGVAATRRRRVRA